MRSKRILFVFCMLFLFFAGCSDESKEESSSGCSDSSDYGNVTLNSLMKDYQTETSYNGECAEAIRGIHYYQNYTKEEIEQAFNLYPGTKFTFGDKCYDYSTKEEMTCPDYIPSVITVEDVAGCTIYTESPDFDNYACILDDSIIYFSTSDDYFKLTSAKFIHNYKEILENPTLYIPSFERFQSADSSLCFYIRDNNKAFFMRKDESGVANIFMYMDVTVD